MFDYERDNFFAISVIDKDRIGFCGLGCAGTKEWGGRKR
jgi:hypothetical protein